MNITEPSECVSRWRLHESEFGYGIRYVEGIKHSLADCMIRIRTTGDTPAAV